VSSFLLAQTNSNKNLLINKNDIEIEYFKSYNENIIDFKYGLTEDIELIPVGFRYRFINDRINQSLIQLIAFLVAGIYITYFLFNVKLTNQVTDYPGIKVEVESLGIEVSFSQDRLKAQMAEHILNSL
jgi:hypothetical protein